MWQVRLRTARSVYYTLLCVRGPKELCGFYRREDPDTVQLVDDMDETLFATVLRHFQHVLRYILPDKRTNTY